MSIATAITDLSGRIQDAYSALSAKGATMPATKDTYHLSSTIDSIPSGGGSSDPYTRIIYIEAGAQNNFKLSKTIQSGLFSSLPTGVNPGWMRFMQVGYGVTGIGESLCNGAGYLTLVQLPSTLTTIGKQAFSSCSRLTEIDFPEGLQSIGYSAFRYSELTSVVIPNSVTSIGESAFAQNSHLANVTIGNSVTSIGQSAFEGCASSFTITLEGKTVAQIQAMNPIYWFGWSDMTVTLVGTDGSYQLVISCFKKGTNITLADGTTKKIEDLTYDDVLKVWDFDEGQLGFAKVCWLTRPGLKNDHYYKLTFSDGTVLNTTGRNSNHKIYNVDKRKFEGVDKTQIGDRIYSLNGIVTVVDKQYIEDEVEYYNVMTTGKINCFAEGILASDRYGNMYPIDENMKYVKDGRAIRPYSDYEAVGIDKYWYDNLRLGEVPETVEETKNYIMKVVNQMLPLPTGDVS